MARRPLVPVNYQVGAMGGGMPLPDQSRTMRSPDHHFQIRTPPFCIQPVAIAPVLPGDTLERCRVAARVVTDPLDGKMLGWWTRLHLFYVKHRDTDYSDELQAMVLQPFTATGLPTVSGGGYATNRLNGRFDQVKACLDVVTRWYFRDEGEDETDHVHAFTGLPMAKLDWSNWRNSLQATTTLGATAAGDVNVDINASGTITASEVQFAMQEYQWLQQNNLTNMTYEDWLATYGVRTRRAEVNRPERLWDGKWWTFPSNTVTQGTGAVTSAATWSIAEQPRFGGQGKFFAEPGWLLLVSVTMPKPMLRSQTGAAVNMLDNAFGWLPAVLRNDPSTSLMAFDTVNGAISSDTANGGLYTFDARDLFMYGDQFYYIAPSVAGADSVAAGGVAMTNIPTAERVKLPMSFNLNTGRYDYPGGSLAEANIFFAGTTNETNLVQIDGLFTPHIRSTVVDTTPGVPVRA